MEISTLNRSIENDFPATAKFDVKLNLITVTFTVISIFVLKKKNLNQIFSMETACAK